MRCFFAIELAASIRSALERATRDMRGPGRDVRWYGGEQLHVTVKFLGEIAEADAPRATAIALDAARRVLPFPLEVAELGGFPNDGRPRVLWAGVRDPTGRCATWLSLADPGFEALGVARESRPFRPHVTLARSRSRAGGYELARILAAAPIVPAMAMEVERLTLFESRGAAGGSSYAVLARVPG